MSSTGHTMQLKENQLDALREMANIGAGHAATALSGMLGSTVMISVPRINVATLAEMPRIVSESEEPVAAVLLHMLGDLTGRTLLVFPRAAALRLAQLLLRRPIVSSAEFGKMEQSAINEVGNILSSAYMNALASCMGMMLLPSPPSLAVDVSSVVLMMTNPQIAAEETILCVESEFLMKDSDERLRGLFLLLPDPASLTAILRAVHVA